MKLAVSAFYLACATFTLAVALWLVGLPWADIHTLSGSALNALHIVGLAASGVVTLLCGACALVVWSEDL